MNYPETYGPDEAYGRWKESRNTDGQWEAFKAGWDFREKEITHLKNELTHRNERLMEFTGFAVELNKIKRMGDVLAHEIMYKDHPSVLDAWWKARGGHDGCTVCNAVPDLGEPKAG